MAALSRLESPTYPDRILLVPKSTLTSATACQAAILISTGMAQLVLHNLTTKSAFEPENSLQSFNFLQLPTELRLQIYRLLLVSKHRIKITRNEFPCDRFPNSRQVPHVKYRRDMSNNDIHSQVLITCHRIAREATSILYGRNTWHFVVNTWFQDFLQCIGDNASSIRYCRLRGYALDVPTWSIAIAPCMMMTRLRTFEIELTSTDSRRSPGYPETEAAEDTKTTNALQYMRRLLLVHPTLRANIRSKIEGASSSYKYNLMLVSEEYRMQGDVGCDHATTDRKLTRYRTAMLTLRLR